MSAERVDSWSVFKGLVTQGNLGIRHYTSDDFYDITAYDAGSAAVAAFRMNRGTPSNDLADWETNFMPKSNWAVGVRPYAFATGDFEFSPKAALGSCPAGGSVSVDISMCGTKYMNGGELITDGNAKFGDWVKVQVIDKDNVMQTPGFDPNNPPVLKTWVEKWYVDYKSCKDSIATPYAGLPPAGFYLRLTYNSVGGQVPVGFALNLLMHKAI